MKLYKLKCQLVCRPILPNTHLPVYESPRVQNKLKQKSVIYNKRPMQYITHLGKQFKSINTYDYIIMWNRRRKNPLSSFWELHGSLFVQTPIPFTQGCFMQSLVETVPVVLEKIFKFCHTFLLLLNNLPLVKDMALH